MTRPPVVESPVTESGVRARLGVPAEASTVLVIAESTHWDPNWLLTSDEYYRSTVRRTLDRVIEALLAEPTRVFSLECIFFVERYWRDHPGRREVFGQLVNEGRIRFSGSGVTTPDTLIPEDELLIRDLLLGQEWLRTNGMTPEPRLLYLPDSFGHSPGLPSLLRASGFTYAAVTRIDGMRIPGADMESARNFPRPGSSAEQLIDSGTSDFVWRSGDGSEVLTHWMAHGYGHGDMIASGGLSRFMGLPFAWPDRRATNVDRRVTEYLADLERLSPTPYRLLNIGFDFVRPIPRLVELIDAWNGRHYQRTGTWLVNATTEDYLDLISFHSPSLPTIEFDPNPYWTGFYASRPALKSAARELGRRLIAGDAERAIDTANGVRDGLGHGDRCNFEVGTNRGRAASRSAWWSAVLANHHDFITGTAPDRVARGEQAQILHHAIADSPWPAGRPPGDPAIATTDPAAVSARLRSGLVVLDATWGTAVFDPRRGGTLVSLVTDGVEQILSPSFALRSYTDSGGLWRMGQELHGGTWRLSDDSSRQRGSVTVERHGDIATIEIRPVIEGRVAAIEISVDLRDPDGPTFMVRTAINAANRRTVTLAVAPQSHIAQQSHGSQRTQDSQDSPDSQLSEPNGILMHQPGTIVGRPGKRWYEPTFWPLHSFAATGRLVLATATPTGLHQGSDGTVEVVVARTAVKEIAFGVVPVMAPAWGLRWGAQSASLAFRWIDGEPRSAIKTGRILWDLVDVAVGRHRPAPMIEVVEAGTGDPDSIDDVEILAVKPADRGEGVIVRLRDWGAIALEARPGSHSFSGTDSRPKSRPIAVRLTDSIVGEIVSAWLVDGRERGLAELEHDSRELRFTPPGHLSSIRLEFSSVDLHGSSAPPT
ncbi:MAG: hypothetical protein WBF71_03330 [Microthrixaceae bacterium]